MGSGGLARPSSMHATCVFQLLIAPSMGHPQTHLASVTLTGRMNSSSRSHSIAPSGADSAPQGAAPTLKRVVFSCVAIVLLALWWACAWTVRSVYFGGVWAVRRAAHIVPALLAVVWARRLPTDQLAIFALLVAAWFLRGQVVVLAGHILRLI